MARIAKAHTILCWLACACLALWGCNPAGSNRITQKPIPPQTVFEVLGDPGTPFSAVISDTRASYKLTGVVPLSITLINNFPPVRMVAAKLVGNNALLSLQILSAFTVVQLNSTTEPFGSAAVQLGGSLGALAPAANPDVRFFVKGPAGELFSGLIEDQNNAHAIQSTAPALFLFEAPNGRVDGLFTQAVNLGSFDVDLIFNGAVRSNAKGGPTVNIE